MALIKSRPRIRLVVPAHVYPGDGCDVEVVLDAKRAVECEHVDVRLDGEERVVLGSGNSRRVYRRDLLSLGARLREREPLAAGQTRIPCRFDIPAGLPPSYVGQAAVAEYTVSVHAAIPWWPDARQSFVLPVRALPREREEGDHRVYTTSEHGLRSDEPYMEFTLRSRLILPGDTVRGQLALYNVTYNRYRVLIMSLVGRESLLEGRGRPLGILEAHRLRARRAIETASEGEPMDFALKLPEALPPSHGSRLWSLAWSFEIDIQLGWGQSLRAAVPVEVLPPGSRPIRSRYAVPTIGSPRIAALWRDVAAAHGLSFDEATLSIAGAIGEVTVAVSRDHRGSDGVFLVGELRYPPLELDLDGGLASGLRRMIGGGVRVGAPEWDARHYLTGREAAQVEALARALAEHLVALELADIDDARMLIQRRAAGQVHAELSQFVAEAVAIARRVPEARGAVPPPARMAHVADAWRALARDLRGELLQTCMAVRGHYHGAPCAVVTRWRPDGEPLHTEISLDASEPFDQRHLLSMNDGRLATGDLSLWPGAARKRLAAFEGVLALAVERARLVLCEAAPLADVRQCLLRLESLAALSEALRGSRGPYR